MKTWWSLLGIIPVLESLGLVLKVSTDCPYICFCENLITNCQNNGIDGLPGGIDPEVVSLDLSINKFQVIPEDLKSYNQLKYLNMSYNKIASLGHLDFNGLTKLEMLDLSFNLFHDWKDIHSEAFMRLTNLNYIEFSNNPLRSIPPTSTHFALDSLQILKLNNCSMTMLPSGFVTGVKHIKELHIAANPISELNVALSSKSLKYMDLSNSFLNYIIPNTFQQLEVLETLQLNKNKYLRNITLNSESLLYLDLSECFLESAPFGNMRSLSTLNLFGNILRDVPNEKFVSMPNLVFLNLSLNAITSINENAFKGLEELKTLDISFNKISSIADSTLLDTKSLLTLDLSHNYLTTLDSITSLSVTYLDISYCEIKSVSKYSLSRLPKLNYLSLKRNFIEIIPDLWVGDKLSTLDLSECRIKSINNKTFIEMSYLKKLDLSNNRLTTIQVNNFPQSLRIIKLKDNQWRCDCAALKDMFEWIETHGMFADDLICDSPETVDGLTWESACGETWYPPTEKKDQLWWYSIILLISMLLLLLTVIVLRKFNDIREKRFQEIEERRRQQERETRETLQRMQQMQREYREEANRNAPDPRESQGPPSYNDALLLPRFDSNPSLGSMHSLGSRGSLHGSNPEINKKGKVRRKRRRRRSETNERTQPRTTIEDSNESEPEQTQRPLESDF